ncbi:hypothetical protein [Propionibacterium freudenreichii]|uniref:hypothetical protein n=1 Tax=Propionibacterium freudenreichii TaxID=1744 RepID=UPI0021A90302|nr:hypothetical protein [Propionibacterium freudenreichii]
MTHTMRRKALVPVALLASLCLAGALTACDPQTSGSSSSASKTPKAAKTPTATKTPTASATPTPVEATTTGLTMTGATSGCGTYARDALGKQYPSLKIKVHSTVDSVAALNKTDDLWNVNIGADVGSAKYTVHCDVTGTDQAPVVSNFQAW